MHLIFVLPRFRAAFAGPQPAGGQPFDAGEKAIVAERPADAFGRAQARERIRLGSAGKQLGEIGKALFDRRARTSCRHPRRRDARARSTSANPEAAQPAEPAPD